MQEKTSGDCQRCGNLSYDLTHVPNYHNKQFNGDAYLCPDCLKKLIKNFT